MNETIAMIIGLRPQTVNAVALVDTTPSGQGDLEKFKEASKDFPGLTFSHLSLGDYSFTEFGAELGKSGDETAILLLSAYVDKYGERISFQDSLGLILDNLSQPLFHLWYHGLGDGVLGGKVISHTLQGKTAAQIVVRILEGEPVGQIKVVDKSPNRYILDYRVMQKFGLENQKYPANTYLLNKPVSFYSQFKLRILLVGAFLLFQTALIIFLINTILKKKRTELALRDSEERYSSLFVENNSVMLLIDPATGIIVDANPAACSYYGYLLEKMVGMKLAEISLLPEEKILTEMEKAQSEKRNYFIFQHCLAGGEVRDVEVYSGPITLHGRQLLYSIIHDITERIQLEKQLRQAQKMEAIGSLAGGIAHDFNNILFAISGFAELAQGIVSADSPVRQHLDQIIIAGNRATGLVQQILMYSPHKKHDLQAVTPYLYINEAVRMLQPSIPASVEIHKEIDEDCGEILADPTCIHQIIMNLCTNALHAMENQKGTLTIKLYHKEIGGNATTEQADLPVGSYVVLSVRDTGCGMDKETIDRIFDPFFSTKGVGRGAGIGLAVIHGIVEDLKGLIKVESTPGEGSVFYVYIPTLPGKDIGIAHSIHEKSSTDTSPGKGKERILVVDDESPLVELQKGLLEQHGYTVSATTDSNQALKIFLDHSDQFDLLITRPGHAGTEVVMLCREPCWS